MLDGCLSEASPASPASAASTASHSAAKQNSARPNLLDQSELGRLYKPACSSLSKESTTRSCRDYFPGSPCHALNKNWHMTDPLREASSVSLTAVRESTNPAQTPPCAALPDVTIDVRADPPEAAATSRIPRVDRPPVVLEISSSSPEPSEPRRCLDTPGKWFRPPAQGQKRTRTSSPPSPCRPRKRPSATGRWCEQQHPQYKQETLTRSCFPTQ